MTMLLFEVFNNNNYRANIILFYEFAIRFIITFEKEIYSAINVNIDDGTITSLNQCSGGLYYYGTTSMENNNTNNKVTDYYYLSTVQSNKSYLQKHETEGADTSRIIQQLVGWPSTQALTQAFEKTQTRNFPITTNNIK